MKDVEVKFVANPQTVILFVCNNIFFLSIVQTNLDS